jgi:hypothetical protein
MIKETLVLSPNYAKQKKIDKFWRKLRSVFVTSVFGTSFQFVFYKSYWHYKLTFNSSATDDDRHNHYLTQMPDFGAGIGHQLANWNSGLYFSGIFKLKFAHSSFSTEKWERFFGFGESEIHAKKLLSAKDYKKVRLPIFDSSDLNQIDLVRNIINSYNYPNILFLLEVNQGYERQYETYKVLSEKFFNATSRKDDKLVFSSDTFNIAVHIRRRMKIETTEVWKSRGLENAYFATILNKLVESIGSKKKVAIFLFSQGNQEDFTEFEGFENIQYCLEMDPYASVLHMIKSDLLVSSKSSFSYKPALISKGIQIAPKSFWHQYPPNDDKYILADDNGTFDLEILNQKRINC